MHYAPLLVTTRGNPTGYWTPPPPSPPPFRSPRLRLRPALVAVWITTAALIASAVTSVLHVLATWEAISIDPAGRAAVLTELDVPDEVSERLFWTTAADGAAAVGCGLAFCVAAVLVIRWQSMALGNFGALALPPPRLGPLAAGIAWFVPIWSLFGPKQAYNDLWRSGDARSPAYPSPNMFVKLPVPRWLLRWWLLWVGGSVLGSAAALGAQDPTTLGLTADASLLTAVGQLMLVAAGAYFVRILVTVGERQDARLAALQTARPAPWPAQAPTVTGDWAGPAGNGSSAWTRP
jgi:Domain of unknown function (DUF4328)